MKAPPPSRPSPEREGQIDLADPRAVEERSKTMGKEEEKTARMEKEVAIIKAEVEKAKEASPEEAESRTPVINKERNIDLQLDLEKSDRDGGNGGGESISTAKAHLQKHEQSSTEKNSKFIPLDFQFMACSSGC